MDEEFRFLPADEQMMELRRLAKVYATHHWPERIDAVEAEHQKIVEDRRKRHPQVLTSPKE